MEVSFEQSLDVPNLSRRRHSAPAANHILFSRAADTLGYLDPRAKSENTSLRCSTHFLLISLFESLTEANCESKQNIKQIHSFLHLELALGSPELSNPQSISP